VVVKLALFSLFSRRVIKKFLMTSPASGVKLKRVNVIIYKILLRMDVLFNIGNIFSENTLINNLIWRELITEFCESFSERAKPFRHLADLFWSFVFLENVVETYGIFVVVISLFKSIEVIKELILEL